MNFLFIDFETWWSKDHTLTKMSPADYVMHPETELISMSIKAGLKSPARVFLGEDKIKEVCSKINWGDYAVVAHNMSGFDSMLMAWRLGIKPKMWLCTLAMARPIHTITIGNSLARLVQHYNIGVKDNSALINTQGKHLKDFTQAELEAMKQYNAADTEQCAELFKKLAKHYTAKELWQIDATIRMLVEPAFVLDVSMLETALSVERDQKLKTLLELDKILYTPVERVTSAFDGESVEERVRAMLASSAKFAEFLEKRGVAVPMKVSKTTGKPTYALAKTDEEFLALQDHEDVVVATAARARLSVKSTLLETRINAFLAAGRAAGGKLPIPLHYCGATTTGRWSGWMFNPQNLPRIGAKPKTSDALRNSMKAPKGYKVIVSDLSGIELRVNHFLWKVPSSVSLYQRSPDKADLYKDFASRLYDIAEDEVSKEQRQIGKVAHLGLGFGAGPRTFQKVAKLMGGVDISEVEAASVTYKWREEYAQIVDGWKTCHSMLPHILRGEGVAIDPWGLTSTCAEGIRLPSGRLIRYPHLRKEQADGKSEWWYGNGRNKARIYAGKIDENIVQALARDAIADYAYDFYKATKLYPKLMVHDELVYIVPEEEAQPLLDELQAIMRTPPKWWPELVTWSEGDIAGSYGQAK